MGSHVVCESASLLLNNFEVQNALGNCVGELQERGTNGSAIHNATNMVVPEKAPPTVEVQESSVIQQGETSCVSQFQAATDLCGKLDQVGSQPQQVEADNGTLHIAAHSTTG